MNRIKTLVAAALAAFAVFGASNALAYSESRPFIQSFYAADQGSSITLRAAYCDYTDPVVATYRYTFRIYASDGDVVARRSFTRTHSLACARVSVSFADVYYNGRYYAQVQIDNLSNGGYIRNRARAFSITG